MDLYSRKIVGWSMHDDLEAPLVVDAISMAITRRKPKPGLVHHSDRGSPVHLDRDGPALRDSKIMASMGSKGDPWNNACAESCISTIKNELVKQRTFATRDQARIALFRYIEASYNPLRRHSGLWHAQPRRLRTPILGGKRRCSRRLENRVNGNVAASLWRRTSICCSTAN